jgi:MSHA pilin protein MshC
MNLPSRSRGATLIELVTVVVLVGVLAVLAGPRFFGRSDFDERGYFELSLQAVRYAQKLALASGCDIRVRFDGSSVALHQWINGASCDADAGGSGLSPVSRPGGGVFSETAPPGVSVGSAQFYFDGVGRPRDAGGGFGTLLGAPVSVAVGGRTLTVEPETGFTRCTAGC